MIVRRQPLCQPLGATALPPGAEQPYHKVTRAVLFGVLGAAIYHFYLMYRKA